MYGLEFIAYIRKCFDKIEFLSSSAVYVTH